MHRRAIQHMRKHIMNARKIVRNAIAQRFESTMQNDERDVENAFKFTTSQMIESMKNVTLTLKQIIERNKIKCDSKLIRRVLRKYYAQTNAHQHRDPWVFAQSCERDVVALIDKHCRSMKSSNA